MRSRVTLTFVVDGDEDSAWAVAEGLEQAAIRKNYSQVNAWVESVTGRGGVLGDESNPPASSAEKVERQAGDPMVFGYDGEAITIGGDGGHSR